MKKEKADAMKVYKNCYLGKHKSKQAERRKRRGQTQIVVLEY